MVADTNRNVAVVMLLVPKGLSALRTGMKMSSPEGFCEDYQTTWNPNPINQQGDALWFGVVGQLQLRSPKLSAVEGNNQLGTARTDCNGRSSTYLPFQRPIGGSVTSIGQHLGSNCYLTTSHM